MAYQCRKATPKDYAEAERKALLAEAHARRHRAIADKLKASQTV